MLLISSRFRTNQQDCCSEIRQTHINLRKEFDEEGLAELAESIRQMESSNQSSFVSRKLKANELVAGEPSSGVAPKLAGERNDSGHRT